MSLSLAPEEIAWVLVSAGLQAAQVSEGTGHPVTEGFTTCRVPVTHEDRVGVSWNARYGSYDDKWIHEPQPQLAQCARALEAEGYQTEFVADFPSGYLVVWIVGEF